MSRVPGVARKDMDEAVAHLKEAAAAKKCLQCGCLHVSLKAIEEAFPRQQRPAELEAAIREARNRLTDIRYDCLGCEVCHPALVVNALGVEGDACHADAVPEREGWPPLPGSYTVLRYQAPVAVCTLTDEGLAGAVAAAAGPEVAIVGTMQTENLGIERLIWNTLSNPHIRFVVVCGPDSQRAVGHLPGRSLTALARFGLDEQGRIINAPGKRPFLRNLGPEAVEHFRRMVEVVDLLEVSEPGRIMDAVQDCAGRNPGPAEPFDAGRVVSAVRGYLPQRMVPDPAGYFVVYPDHARNLLLLEHYRNDGVLDTIIEGMTAAELYTPAIVNGLISRLDHAAYLGRELARAEEALRSGEPYRQDAAPELQGAHPTCGCGPSCGGEG